MDRRSRHVDAVWFITFGDAGPLDHRQTAHEPLANPAKATNEQGEQLWARPK
jgi:hypothetical protein